MLTPNLPCTAAPPPPHPQLLDKIRELNYDHTVHGILIQMPLDSVEPIDESEVTEAVAPHKDADGFHSANTGKLAKRGNLPDLLPCTPHGCLYMLDKTGAVEHREEGFEILCVCLFVGSFN